MPRIRPDEIENYTEKKYDSDWLQLKNDRDSADIQFMYHNIDDLDIFVAHPVEINGSTKYVNCIRSSYDDPVDVCPLCAHGYKTHTQVVLSMVDVNDKRIKVWQRGPSFLKKLRPYFDNYGDLTDKVFKIERIGVKGDQQTSYELIPLPGDRAIDISQYTKPEFLGSVILDKNADEMEYFINNNQFPQTNNKSNNNSTNSSDEPVRRRSSDDGYTVDTPRTSRRGF